jgi:hypothetical protein
MPDDTVVSLASTTNDSTYQSVESCLTLALQTQREHDMGRKCIVLILDDENESYDVASFTANIKSSEVVALLEAEKISHLNLMGYGND